jgi:hypothetical protein
MARSFLTAVNLNQNELQNPRIQNLASAPGSPVVGQIYHDTVLLASYIWNGSAWVSADASKLSGTIPNTALATNPLARANHTGTQVSATISDLATVVQGYHLNQFAVPTANVPMAGFKLTGLNTAPTASGDSAEYSWVVARNLNAIAAATATSANVPMAGFKFTGLGTPSGAGDSAEYSWVLARPLSAFATPIANLAMGGFKLTGLATPTTAGDSAEYSWVISQVQSAAAGIASKQPVRLIATTNNALSGLGAIDSVTPIAGDRVLVTGQTTTTANGVYLAASGAWTRTTSEGPAPGELEAGALWLVTEGTTNTGTQWRCSNTGVITIGTTAIAVVQFGAASSYSAGIGILLTGSVFSAVPNPAAGSGIIVSMGGISVDTAVVARKYATSIGDGSSTSYVVTHSLGTQDVIMQVRQVATPYAEVECDMQSTSTTTSTFVFTVAPTTNQYRVMVIG